ncbi:hypothetical protein Tco_0392783 [Tanacetum coccineum]
MQLSMIRSKMDDLRSAKASNPGSMDHSHYLKMILERSKPSCCARKFLALGWHLEEIHVTWAHLEKKRTSLWLYTKYLEEPRIQSVEMVSLV